VAWVIRSRRASISSVQRQQRIGYNRAALLVEDMEKAGILSSMATNGSREVLVPDPLIDSPRPIVQARCPANATVDFAGFAAVT